MSKNTGTSELINYFTLGASGAVDIGGNLTLSTIANATTDTDKFLVSDTGIIKYRTGAELLTDIGAAPATGGSYLPLAGGTLTGALGGTSGSKDRRPETTSWAPARTCRAHRTQRLPRACSRSSTASARCSMSSGSP